MSRANGPTAKVLAFAAAQPGALISWSEARDAYATGVVKGWLGPKGGAAHHNMSISNVLHRHFVRVEGARGLYALLSSMANASVEDDEDEMRTFHAIHGCDEFGMSLSKAEHAMQRRLVRTQRGLARMSDIDIHQCDREMLEASDSARECEELCGEAP